MLFPSTVCFGCPRSLFRGDVFILGSVLIRVVKPFPDLAAYQLRTETTIGRFRNTNPRRICPVQTNSRLACETTPHPTARAPNRRSTTPSPVLRSNSNPTGGNPKLSRSSDKRYQSHRPNLCTGGNKKAQFSAGFTATPLGSPQTVINDRKPPGKGRPATEIPLPAGLEGHAATIVQVPLNRPPESGRLKGHAWPGPFNHPRVEEIHPGPLHFGQGLLGRSEGRKG